MTGKRGVLGNHHDWAFGLLREQGVDSIQAPGVSKYLGRWVQVPVFMGSCPIF